jgi:intracellular septation protein A
MSTRPNPLYEIAVTIVAPAVVLMQASAENRLGPTWALLLALALPLAWGLNSWRRAQGFGVMAAIGVVSTLLTGGIGVLRLDASWLQVKEAAVPALLGLAVAVSAFTRQPLIHLLVFSPTLFDVPRIAAALAERGTSQAFEQRMRTATLWFAATFAFSAVMNYWLAGRIVTSPAGSEAFNEELGRLTLVSYPVIALPSLAMTMALLWWIARGVREFAGLGFDDILLAAQPDEAVAEPDNKAP